MEHTEDNMKVRIRKFDVFCRSFCLTVGIYLTDGNNYCIKIQWRFDF